MPVLTIVRHYIEAALDHAVGETLADGTVVLTIPELPGVIVYGADETECARQLFPLIEDTVKAWLASGCDVPVIDSIDLNSEKAQVLASYHDFDDASQQGTVYENEVALERAFEERRKSA